MSEISLNIERRSETGTQYSKKLKREGKVPGIYYFHGSDPIPFSVELKSLQAIAGHESGMLSIKIDGKEEKKCVVREIQYDPIRMEPIHIDLLGIKLDEKIKVTVPVHLTGSSVGVKNSGGVLQHVLREVEIECFPADIPENFSADVSDLDIGDTMYLDVLKDDKFSFSAEDDTVVATVTAPRIAEETVESEESEEGSAEPEVLKQSDSDED